MKPGTGTNSVAKTRDELAENALDLRRELAANHTQSFGWALACCHWDKDTAEDVLHSSYLKILEGRAQFAGRSNFRTWLFAVIRTTAHEGRRKRRRRRLAWQEHGPMISSSAPAAPDGTADTARLRSELTALPRRQREALHLVFYGELSISEAAKVMKVSLGTARTHYERGKHKLRERLEVEDFKHG